MLFDNIFSFASEGAKSGEDIDPKLSGKIPGAEPDAKIVREVSPEASAVLGFINTLTGAIQQNANAQKTYANDPGSTAQAASSVMKKSRESLESDPDLMKYSARERLGQRFPTINLAAGKVVTASTELASNRASKAIDGSTATYWCPEKDKGPSWWKVDLETPQRIGLIVLDTQAYEGKLKNFQVLASEDDKQYVVLEEQGDSMLPSKQAFRLQVDDSKRYRYIKVAKTVKELGYDLTLTQVHIEPPLERF